MWTVCITSIRHVLKLNGYGGRQAKANEKRQRFKGWETLVNKINVPNFNIILGKFVANIFKYVTKNCHDKASSTAKFSFIYAIIPSEAIPSFAIPITSTTLRPCCSKARFHSSPCDLARKSP